MSGLFAVFERNGAPVVRAQLDNALASMACRGRDQAGVWHQGSVGLAAAITHWAEDAQPLPQPFTLDGSKHILAAALLTNRAELRRSLENEGQGTEPVVSDAELVLRAYSAWGTRCTEHLRGEFAAVLWDENNRSLLAFTDPFGTLPLFVLETPQRVLLSTDLDTIVRFPGVDDALNDQAVGDTLIYGFQQSRTSTIYAQIDRLPGGHQVQVDAKHSRRSLYWAPEESTPLRSVGDPRALVEEFHGRLKQAVLSRARLERIGIELSGGLDTSSIAQVLCQDADARTQRRLRGFCHGFSGPAGEAEPALARETADYLGLELEVSWQDREHPLATTRPSSLPPEPQTFFWDAGLEHGRRAAAHSPILFSGHGGDMALGYVEYHWTRQLLERPGGAARDLSTFFRMFGFKRPPLGIRNWMKQRQGASESSMPVPTWLSEDLLGNASQLERVADVESRDESFRQRLGMWFSPVSSMIFSRTDAAYYGVPLRCVYPYFDLDLWTFLQTVPPIPYFVKKALLRVDMKGRLPDAVVTRPKAHLADRSHPAMETMLRDGVPAWYFEQLEAPHLQRYVDGAQVARRLRQLDRLGKAEFLQCAAAVHLGAWLDHRARER